MEADKTGTRVAMRTARRSVTRRAVRRSARAPSAATAAPATSPSARAASTWVSLVRIACEDALRSRAASRTPPRNPATKAKKPTVTGSRTAVRIRLPSRRRAGTLGGDCMPMLLLRARTAGTAPGRGTARPWGLGGGGVPGWSSARTRGAWPPATTASSRDRWTAGTGVARSFSRSTFRKGRLIVRVAGSGGNPPGSSRPRISTKRPAWCRRTAS
jgi:hypothetical protein